MTLEAHFKKKLHPSEIEHIDGIAGVVTPMMSGPIPVGVFEMSNNTERMVERRDRMEDSAAGSSNLLANQIDGAERALSQKAMSTAQPTMEWTGSDVAGVVAPTPVKKPEPEHNDEQGDGSDIGNTAKKRKTATVKKRKADDGDSSLESDGDRLCW